MDRNYFEFTSNEYEAFAAASTRSSVISRWIFGPSYSQSYPQAPLTDSGGRRRATNLGSNSFHSIIGNISHRGWLILIIIALIACTIWNSWTISGPYDDIESFRRPTFVNERPYISSTYYSTTMSKETLFAGTDQSPQIHALATKNIESKRTLSPKTKLAVLRPFCAFDAEALPTTFAVWETLAPCRAASSDIGDNDKDLDYPSGNLSEGERKRPMAADASADLFLFYSQTFADSPEAIAAVDEIIRTFNEPGGWSQCFDNIYAIEANLPPELDLYIPSAQEELYNWVNGPNRQYEAAFRVIQSGEWGEFDGFYLMEGDSIPVKTHWLDQLYGAVEENRPFAILGAKYDGDKWDQFYQKIPYSLLNHLNGNGIYNVSHPLLERLVSQLEVEAPCPYNSIPYDYRMSQMYIEGEFGIVPKLATKIMLNEDGQNITLSDNTAMFKKWWDMWQTEKPFKETPIIHNYAATNLIPRHLGAEYVIHGAKLYSPWDPTETKISLVVSEWLSDRSKRLLETLDSREHPFSEVVLMLPPDVPKKEAYDETVVPVRPHHRVAPDFMDMCEAPVETEWFMMTNSYHIVAGHVDLMFTPGTFKPLVPFTPATYAFCFKFPYCKEIVNLAQRINPKHDKVVLDFDMLYNTKERDAFCNKWKEDNGEEGEDLYIKDKRALKRKQFIGPKGPTGTAYMAYLVSQGIDNIYKFTDRSLYGARDSFVKVFSLEETLDGMTAAKFEQAVVEEKLLNQTSCSCAQFESEASCTDAAFACIWRPRFDTCHPPGLLDNEEPDCLVTESPTFAPTPDQGISAWTDAPAPSPAGTTAPVDPWFAKLFKTRSHIVTQPPLGSTRVTSSSPAQLATIQHSEKPNNTPASDAPTKPPLESTRVSSSPTQLATTQHSEKPNKTPTTDASTRPPLVPTKVTSSPTQLTTIQHSEKPNKTSTTDAPTKVTSSPTQPLDKAAIKPKRKPNKTPAPLLFGVADSFAIACGGAVTISANAILHGDVVTRSVFTTGDSSAVFGHIDCVGAATVGANSNFSGIIISQGAVTVGANAKIPGGKFTGDILSLGGVTVGASRNIAGNIYACSTFTLGYGASVNGEVLQGAAGLPVPSSNETKVLADVYKAFSYLKAQPGAEDLETSIKKNALKPGIYSHVGAWSFGAGRTITFKGTSTDTWIIQIGGAVNIVGNIYCIGALPSNVKWVVTGAVNVNAGANFCGYTVTPAAIGLAAGSSLQGSIYSSIGDCYLGDGANLTKF